MKRTVTLCLLVCSVCVAAVAKGPSFTDPDKANKEDPAFSIQGEYSGKLSFGDREVKIGSQVIALGNGKLRSVSYIGGLPGDGWNQENKRELDGELKDGVAIFNGERVDAKIKDGVMSLTTTNGNELGKLERVQRKSETLGKKPSAGAVVLFDGKSADEFGSRAKVEDGLLLPPALSKRKFGDHSVHIEFRLPYEPEDRGQARGNSGIYLQGRYEVQMLDSFGLEGKENECGGIYSVGPPSINMCYPPLSWQTYDIDYTAANYDDDGNVTSPPRITVRHNGVVIHKDVKLPADRNTTAAPLKAGPEPGPLYLQDHGDPVRYRNIWVVEK